MTEADGASCLPDVVERRGPRADAARPVGDAGQQVEVEGTTIGPVEAIAGDMAAWTAGHLIVDNARLADVIAELDRYRRGRLGCDPRVTELRVSGAFPVLDVDRALAALEATLPVRVDRANAYWATVRPRGA